EEELDRLYRESGDRDQLVQWQRIRIATLNAELPGLSKRLAENPEDVAGLTRRAELLIHAGRFESAAADYGRLVALEAEEPWPWYVRACLLAYLDRKDEYREHC